VTKIYYLELLRVSEGTLSCWSRHLQSLASTPVLRRVDVRQAAGRKKNCRIITTWWKTCCTDPLSGIRVGRKRLYIIKLSWGCKWENISITLNTIKSLFYIIIIIIVPLSYYVGSAWHVFFFHSFLSLVISMLAPFILLESPFCLISCQHVCWQLISC
jgi:hypothetical protein